jgi:hypothetical protein
MPYSVETNRSRHLITGLQGVTLTYGDFMVQHKIGDQTEFSLVPQNCFSHLNWYLRGVSSPALHSPLLGPSGQVLSGLKSYKSGELMMPSFINQCQNFLTFQLPSY